MMDNKVAAQLIGTGLLLGMVHVLSGPDHLSALATLSVGSTYKAFALGIRWGLGHSTGLLLIAVIFLSLKEGQLDIHELEAYCGWIVGIFMIGMGLWSMYGIYLKKKNLQLAEAAGTNKTEVVVELGPIGNEIHHEAQLTIKESLEVISEEQVSVTSSKPAKEAAKSIFRIPSWEKIKELAYKENHCMQKVVAFVVGIIHGIAGPGGILGVLPAVELHDWGKSMLYLFSFILTSTLAMGVFAAVYGELTHRLGSATKIEYWLSIISASLSLIVGILWLVLLSIGKLDDIFE